MKLTHAIILAAGLGTRMRPLTNTLPKPLIPVAGKPLIDWCLDWLEQANIVQVVINTSYRADQLEAHLAGRPSPRVRCSREEPTPLETGGGIAKALPMLGGAPFLAMNSDAIFPPPPQGDGWGGGIPSTFDAASLTASAQASPPPNLPPVGGGNVHPITRLEEAWSNDLDFLMLVVPKANTIGWEGRGDFVVDDIGRVRRPREGEDAPYVFTGVEIIHPRVFEGCPEGAFSLSKLWNARLGEEGFFTRIRAIIHEGDWLNVGDLQGLAAAEAYSGMSTGKRR